MLVRQAIFMRTKPAGRVDAPRIGLPGIAASATTVAAVVAGYTALALGYVHAIYVFAPA